MKLAEALILRADTQKYIEQLKARLQRCVQVQEGDEPPEDPRVLLNELDSAFTQLKILIQQINRTNAHTPFAESHTLTDALAERDLLSRRRNALQNILEEATSSQRRYGRSEIKYIVTINTRDIQNQVDQLARQFRELDTAIQQLNWSIDLQE